MSAFVLTISIWFILGALVQVVHVAGGLEFKPSNVGQACVRAVLWTAVGTIGLMLWWNR